MNPLATPWRLRNRPLNDSPVMGAAMSPPLYGGNGLMSKLTRILVQTLWQTCWLGFTRRLVGMLGEILRSRLPRRPGRTFAPSRALTYAGTTEKQNKRIRRHENTKKQNKNIQRQKLHSIRARRYDDCRHVSGLEKKHSH